jgi:hypothetical protein
MPKNGKVQKLTLADVKKAKANIGKVSKSSVMFEKQHGLTKDEAEKLSAAVVVLDQFIVKIDLGTGDSVSFGTPFPQMKITKSSQGFIVDFITAKGSVSKTMGAWCPPGMTS